DSEEFMVEAENGEDSVVLSEDNSYASNIEVAVSHADAVSRISSDKKLEEFHTPGIKTIDELAALMGTADKSRLAKSRVFVIQPKEDAENKKNQYALALICGDDEFNEQKLETVFPGIRAAFPHELMDAAGAEAGSIGPVGFKSADVKIIADLRLK